MEGAAAGGGHEDERGIRAQDERPAAGPAGVPFIGLVAGRCHSGATKGLRTKGRRGRGAQEGEKTTRMGRARGGSEVGGGKDSEPGFASRGRPSVVRTSSHPASVRGPRRIFYLAPAYQSRTSTYVHCPCCFPRGGSGTLHSITDFLGPFMTSQLRENQQVSNAPKLREVSNAGAQSGPIRTCSYSNKSKALSTCGSIREANTVIRKETRSNTFRSPPTTQRPRLG